MLVQKADKLVARLLDRRVLRRARTTWCDTIEALLFPRRL